MALNIADAMGRLLRNNLSPNRPMNAPAARTPDPVPAWASSQGITQQMWDSLTPAQRASMSERIDSRGLNWDEAAAKWGVDTTFLDRDGQPIRQERVVEPRIFDREEHERQRPFMEEWINERRGGGGSEETLNPQATPRDTIPTDVATPPEFDDPSRRVPRWASETFGFTQDNWNRMGPSEKTEVFKRYALMVEGRSADTVFTAKLAPGADSPEAPPTLDTSIRRPAPPLVPGDPGYQYDPPPTEEFENQSASQRVMDTVPQLAPGERQEHLDTGVNLYPADTVFTPEPQIQRSTEIGRVENDSQEARDRVTPVGRQYAPPDSATVDEPAGTGPLPRDRFAGMSIEERLEALGLNTERKRGWHPRNWGEPGINREYPWETGRADFTTMPEGMDRATWDKITMIGYDGGGFLERNSGLPKALRDLERITNPNLQGITGEWFGDLSEDQAIRDEYQFLKSQGKHEEAEAYLESERSNLGQGNIDARVRRYIEENDPEIRAFIEGRWRPGVENFDLAGELIDKYGGETSPLLEGIIRDTPLPATGRDDWLNPDTEETVEEVAQASTTPGLTPAQQIEQDIQELGSRTGPRGPMTRIETPIDVPKIPKIDFSREEVRPERIRPLTGMERFASAADSLLQRPGMAEGLTQLGTSLLQGEGLGAGLEELSGEITSADDVIREQEQLAEEEAKAQGKREAFGGLLQEIVEGPPEGVDPQKWQGGLLSEATEIGGVEGAKVVQEFFPEETEPLGPDWQYEKLNDSSYLLWNKNNPTQSQIVNHRPEGATDGGGQSVNEGLARLALVNFLGGQEEDPTYQNLPKTFRLAGITMNDQGVLESAGVLNKNFWKAHFADQVSGPNAMESTLIKGVIKGGMRGFIDDETGVAMQNALNAINPVVRWLSGAQMTNAEALRYYNALIPMPGEKPKTVMAKMANQLILGAAMNPNTNKADLLALGIADTQLMDDLRGAIDRLGGENSTEAEWKELDSLLMVHMSPAGLQQQVAAKIEQDVYQNYQADEAGLRDKISGVASNIAGRFSRGG